MRRRSGKEDPACQDDATLTDKRLDCERALLADLSHSSSTCSLLPTQQTQIASPSLHYHPYDITTSMDEVKSFLEKHDKVRLPSRLEPSSFRSSSDHLLRPPATLLRSPRRLKSAQRSDRLSLRRRSRVMFIRRTLPLWISSDTYTIIVRPFAGRPHPARPRALTPFLSSTCTYRAPRPAHS